MLGVNDDVTIQMVNLKDLKEAFDRYDSLGWLRSI